MSTITKEKPGPLEKESKAVRLLERISPHGFEEFNSLESLSEYFSGESGLESLEFQPHSGKSKPSATDRARSRGDI